MRVLFVVACAVAVGGLLVHGQQAAEPAASQTPAALDPTPHPERMVGTWKYDEGASLDAATGQPERGAAARRAPDGPAAGPDSGLNAPPSGTGVTSCFGCPVTGGGDPNAGAVILGLNNLANAAAGGPAPVGAPPASERELAEARDLVRDLNEIPETLTIAASPALLDITDDLGRELTFPIDGKKRPYHLSASSFEAAAHWSGPAVEVDLSGAHGFRMTEVFLADATARHLFELIRIGSPPKTNTTSSRPVGSSGGLRGGGGGPGTMGAGRGAGLPPGPVGSQPPSPSTSSAPSTVDTPHPAGVNRVFDKVGG